MGFLPKEFKESISNSRYWKIKDMPQGESRFRIVQAPIFGWIDWKDDKPHRYRHEKKPLKSFDPEKAVRPFVSCYVWDYARKGLFVLEFSQKTLIMALDNLYASEDWGDVTEYDLKLKKEGTGQKSRYTLNPAPHKPMSDEIKAAMKASPAFLDALFSNGDPWYWTAGIVSESPIESFDEEDDGFDAVLLPEVNKQASEPMSPLEELKELLEVDGIPSEKLEDWVKLRCLTRSQTPEVVIKTCMTQGNLDLFKKSFQKWIGSPDVPQAQAV